MSHLNLILKEWVKPNTQIRDEENFEEYVMAKIQAHEYLTDMYNDLRSDRKYHATALNGYVLRFESSKDGVNYTVVGESEDVTLFDLIPSMLSNIFNTINIDTVLLRAVEESEEVTEVEITEIETDIELIVKFYNGETVYMTIRELSKPLDYDTIEDEETKVKPLFDKAWSMGEELKNLDFTQYS